MTTLADLRRSKRDWMYVQTQPILIGEETPRFATDAQMIMHQVANDYGLLVKDLRGPRRDRRVAWPRQHAMYRMYVERNLSLPTIGRLLGGRDHTTVLHGVRQHKKRLAEGHPCKKTGVA